MTSVIKHTTRRGTIAHFAADQCIGQALDLYGEWAEEEIALLRPYVMKGSTVVDVGANVGVHTHAFAEMVGPPGKVVSIEGQPEVFDLLAANVLDNGLLPVVRTVYALAGETIALVPYTVQREGENVGAKSFVVEVHHPADRQIYGEITVLLPLLTIDSLSLASCSLMKIDVEGMELDVLRGASDTLRRFQPVLYFEFASGDVSVMIAIYDYLKVFGYRLFWHIANPFNRLNMKGHMHNIFGGSVEINVLAVGPDQPLPALDEIIDPSLPPYKPSLEEMIGGSAIA